MLIPRYHMIIRSSKVMTAWTSRVIAAVSQILLLRLTTDYLNEGSNYAIYAVFGGLGLLGTVVDLGIGQAIQNLIIEHRAKERDHQGLISSAITLTAINVVLMMGLLLIGMKWLGPWYLHAVAAAWPERLQAVTVFWAGSILAAQVFLSLAFRILYGLDRIVTANIVMITAPLLSLLAMVLLRSLHHHGGPLQALLATSGVQATFGLVVLSSILFTNSRNHIRAPQTKADGVAFRPLLQRSIQFWLFSLTSMLVLQLDIVILSRLHDQDDLVSYAFCSKLFLFINVLIHAFLATQAPLITRAYALRDLAALQRHLRHSVYLSLAFAVLFSTGIILLINPILHLLSPHLDIRAPIALLLLLGLYHLVRAWTDCYAVALLSESVLKPLWLSVPFQAGVSISAQLVLSRIYGAKGIVGGLLLSYLLTVTWFLPRQHRRLMSMRVPAETTP